MSANGEPTRASDTYPVDPHHSQLAVEPFPSTAGSVILTWTGNGEMLNGRVADIRILVVTAGTAHHVLRRRLNSLGISPVLVNDAAELANHVRREQVYEVVILPAAVSDADWWGIWAELTLLNIRPEILVYAKENSFQLWSNVLEAGGFDVIVEPFADAKLKTALMRAARNFRVRLRNGSAHE